MAQPACPDRPPGFTSTTGEEANLKKQSLILDLRTRLASKERHWKNATDNAERYFQENKELQQQKQQMMDEIGTMVGMNVMLQAQIGELEERRSRDAERLTQENKDLQQQMRQMMDIIGYMGRTTDRLRSQIGESEERRSRDAERLSQGIRGLHQETKQMKHNMGAMSLTNDWLQAQIGQWEKRWSKETAAGEVYSSYEADVATLAADADAMKQSLADFAWTLMQGMAGVEKQQLVQKLHPGIQFSNNIAGVKYVFQEWASKIVLAGLWESETFSHKCCPEGGQKIEEIQKLCFDRYNQFKDASIPSHKIDAMLDSASSSTSGLHGSVVGQLAELTDFSLYCKERWTTMIQERPDILGHSQIIQLRQAFVGLLLRVWEAQLLTLAFEQPATLFKVRSGTKFSPAYMQATREPNSSTSQLSVAFMVVPGFRVGKSVVKSLVYLCDDDSLVSAEKESADSPVSADWRSLWAKSLASVDSDAIWAKRFADSEDSEPAYLEYSSDCLEDSD